MTDACLVAPVCRRVTGERVAAVPVALIHSALPQAALPHATPARSARRTCTPVDFAAAYGREGFVRRGAVPGVLDALDALPAGERGRESRLQPV